MGASSAHKPSSAPQTNWLNLYELSSYKEEWTATIQVRNLDSDAPRVLADFKAQGVEPIEPVANFARSKIAHTQQMSFRLSQPQAEAATLAVKKDGFFILGLRQEPASGNAPLLDIDAKIKALMSERAANRRALSRMPAINALTNQMLSRLVMVREVQARAQKTVLFNVTIAGKT